MNRYLLSVSIIFISTILHGQKPLTLEESILGRYSFLAPHDISKVKWSDNNESFYFLFSGTTQEYLIHQKNGAFQGDTILTATDLYRKAGIENRFKFPDIYWVSESTFFFRRKDKLYSYDIVRDVLEEKSELPFGADNIFFRPRSEDFAYTVGNNLYISVSGREIQVTDNEETVISGQTVSRIEFGIDHGIFWSPDGKYLAFYEKDVSAVSEYTFPFEDIEKSATQTIRYPRAGEASEKVKVGLFRVSSGEKYYLDVSGPEDQYITSVTWDPKSRYVFAATLSRDQKDLRMNKYSAKDGSFLHEIFYETSNKYVHPQHPLFFVDSENFAWISERSGIAQFYLYSIYGEFLGHIRIPDIIAQDFLGIDSKNGKMYFLGNHKESIGRHIYMVILDDEKAWVDADAGFVYNYRQLTQEDRFYEKVWYNPNSPYIVATSSSIDEPRVAEYIDPIKEESTTFFVANNPLSKFHVGGIQLFNFRTEDSTLLFGRVIKPYDFDPLIKYPVLLYVYNGPGVQLINNRWLSGAPPWMFHLANKGFIVVTIDGRGSANRGLPFEQVTYKKLGQIEMKDQIDGLNYVGRNYFIDLDKVVVHGWSYGGFMTLSLLENYPESFIGGVAGGAVTDWKFYEIMYTERYMETPQKNPQGYEKTSTLNKVSNISDELLLIHGAEDPTVIPEHFVAFKKSCDEHNIPVRTMIIPKAEHNVYGEERVRMMEHVIEFIEESVQKTRE